MTPGRVVAFGPGRVNLIGEHTDYNDGLALAFAIERGVSVTAQTTPGEEIEAVAEDLGERDRFALDAIEPAGGWRAYVRGVVAELQAAGHRLPGATLLITSTLPRQAGLSSSAALEVALCLALLGLCDEPSPDAVSLASLCARVEHRWARVDSGLLDQLSSLCGREGHALAIDFRSLAIEPVALSLGEWTLAMLEGGPARALPSSGYNERRSECHHARRLLGLQSLRDAVPADVARLPTPLDRRLRHVLEENARVQQAVALLAQGDLAGLGTLLDQSHASLRDLYECSTPEVERAVSAAKSAGAAGARIHGGGFGGQVLALFEPGVVLPAGALVVSPRAGAHVRVSDPA